MRKGCFWLHDRAKWPDDFIFWGMSVSHARREKHPIVPHDTRHGNPLLERLPTTLHTLIVNQDRVKVTVDGRESYLSPGTICIWDQSKKVFYGEPRAEWRMGYLQVNGEKFERWLAELKLKVNVTLNWLDIATVEQYLDRILYECEHYVRPDIAILENQLYGLLLEMRRANKIQTAKQPKIPAKIREVKNHLDLNYNQLTSLSELAEACQLSTAYLSRKFKKCYQKSPMDYLIDLRLRHASGLLVETDDKIGDISRQVGFSDVFHFSRIFKKRIGFSPKAYRKGK